MYNSYSSEATDALVEIVSKLQLYEDIVKIEYYNNSKIIKSVDGIDKFDYDKLLERLKYVMEQKAETLKQEQLEQDYTKYILCYWK